MKKGNTSLMTAELHKTPQQMFMSLIERQRKSTLQLSKFSQERFLQTPPLSPMHTVLLELEAVVILTLRQFAFSFSHKSLLG